MSEQPTVTGLLYRKKPAVVEAMRFDQPGKDIINRLQVWIRAGDGLSMWHFNVTDSDFMIHTREGWLKATVGCWIIKGVAGEFYPCDPEIFEATYEPA